MYGAILGDMVGAPYEYGMSEKIKDFPMWKESSRKTDDTVMTIAVAEALLNTIDISQMIKLKTLLLNQ